MKVVALSTKSGTLPASFSYSDATKLLFPHELAMNLISTADLQELKRKQPDLVIINTLPREHFEKTSIPGAISIPVDEPEFADRVALAAGAKTNRLVVYCANEHCDSSERATKKLEAAGFTNVLTYKGGAEAWKHEAHLQHADA
jgi:rhodanese-related sulfurtransferase